MDNFEMKKKERDSLSPSILMAIRNALAEDIGSGDLTTESIVPTGAMMNGKIIAKQDGIIAGLDIARSVYRMLDQKIDFERCVPEGSRVSNQDLLALVHGSARSLLIGERTALNFIGRMSGIATLTRQFVEAVAGTKAMILDTRKTAPGLRAVDKLAVKLGGGQNHRVGLYDMILIKDNHIDFAGSIKEAVRLSRLANAGVEIEVEARTLGDVVEALEIGVSRILLDNMTLEMMRQAVEMTGEQAKLEASGNVTLENVHQVAETGVDYISVGALTHSARVFDVSFLFIR